LDYKVLYDESVEERMSLYKDLLKSQRTVEELSDINTGKDILIKEFKIQIKVDGDIIKKYQKDFAEMKGKAEQFDKFGGRHWEMKQFDLMVNVVEGIDISYEYNDSAGDTPEVYDALKNALDLLMGGCFCLGNGGVEDVSEFEVGKFMYVSALAIIKDMLGDNGEGSEHIESIEVLKMQNELARQFLEVLEKERDNGASK